MIYTQFEDTILVVQTIQIIPALEEPDQIPINQSNRCNWSK